MKKNLSIILSLIALVGVVVLAVVMACLNVSLSKVSLDTFINSVFWGFSGGYAVYLTRLFSAKEYGKLKTAVCTIFITCTAVSLGMTLLGLLTSNRMLFAIHTPADVFYDASVYLKIYILGYLFSFWYNICNGIFTSLGDSRTPLYFLIGSSIGNILLDLFFVLCLKMGVAGVAWATLAAQAAASILAKVTRDMYMEELAEKYPQYGFEIHKGYGTKAHYEALRTYGPSPIHRMTFLKKFYGEK